MDILRTAFIEDAEETQVPVQQISITDEPLSRQEYWREDLLTGMPRREIVRRLQLVRTDLDEFSDLDIDLLIRHGYTVAYKTLTGSLVSSGSIRSVWSVKEPVLLTEPRSHSKLLNGVGEVSKKEAAANRHPLGRRSIKAIFDHRDNKPFGRAPTQNPGPASPRKEWSRLEQKGEACRLDVDQSSHWNPAGLCARRLFGSRRGRAPCWSIAEANRPAGSR